ncbi:hydrolase [Prauserella marina]|uniref:Pimeloyl-ACP methyl ester carboxylesterase n=1 Tax=Prauserella marina TaxID=530584 RepID=A0A222VUU4_9PSEU|nr:alpha/beta hydrolase [Prauserella marina]ASR37688.1 hydrolase [Prauserella marina]PWV75618.1 pimeloyl-ACP methyl ester carboxylesterase [Prauserella marina]SDD30446.1 Pimeloyl-ACP methyl ester carboxylesterase [Prauserella marina]
MYVQLSGDRDGRPVVLLHGGGVAGWMWRLTTDLLPAGLHLIVPDLPGHDRSSGEPYVSHDHTLTELITIIEKEADQPVAVAGFSLGAQLAILLATQRPDLVDRVAVVSAQAIPTRAAGLTLGLLGATAPLAKYEWFAKLQAKQLFIPASLKDDYLRTSALISKRSLVAAVGENIRFTAPPEWAGFPGTALILAGERERGFMRSSARSLSDALPGSELEIVSGCGHGIPLQRPDWFAKRLRDWLST